MEKLFGLLIREAFLVFSDKNENEKGIIDYIDHDLLYAKAKYEVKHLKKGQTLIEVKAEYFRPTEVHNLQGDASKAKKELNWHPIYTFEEVVSEMVESDLKLYFNKKIIHNTNASEESILRNHCLCE